MNGPHFPLFGRIIGNRTKLEEIGRIALIHLGLDYPKKEIFTTILIFCMI